MVVREETTSQWSRAAVVGLVVVAFVGLVQPWYAAGEGVERVSCSGLDLFSCMGGSLVGLSLFVALVASAVDVLWVAGETPQWVVRGALVVGLLAAVLLDPSASLPTLWRSGMPALQPGWFLTVGAQVAALVVSGMLASSPPVARLHRPGRTAAPTGSSRAAARLSRASSGW